MALKGIKQFFGVEKGQKKLKDALEYARLTIKNEYAKLRVTKCKYSEQCGSALSKAWKALKEFECDESSSTDKDIKKAIDECGNVGNGKDFENFLKFTAAFKAVYSHCSRFKGTYPYSTIGDLVNASLEYALYVGTWWKNSERVFNSNDINKITTIKNENMKSKDEKKLDVVFEKELNSITNKIKPGGDPTSLKKALDWVESMAGKVGRALKHPIDSIIAKGDNTAYAVKAKRLKGNSNSSNDMDDDDNINNENESDR